MAHHRMPPGFTLIETIVVIVMIVILMSIILPMLSYAREEAYNAICTSQLDQIYSASFAYGVDWNDRLPFFARIEERPYDDWWVTQIAPGFQNAIEILRCPNDERPSRKVWLTYTKDDGTRGSKLRMADSPILLELLGKSVPLGAFNLDLSYVGFCDTASRPQSGERLAHKFTDWTRPNKVLMLTEGLAKNRRGCFRYGRLKEFYANRHMPHMTKSYTAYMRRHNGTTNYLMMSGSIERLGPQEAGEIAKDWNNYLPYAVNN